MQEGALLLVGRRSCFLQLVARVSGEIAREEVLGAPDDLVELLRVDRVRQGPLHNVVVRVHLASPVGVLVGIAQRGLPYAAYEARKVELLRELDVDFVGDCARYGQPGGVYTMVAWTESMSAWSAPLDERY